ncbi:hypothetical protein CES85_0671 [Ochrobactrum quorumnocens]|uniref:Uncharacterized protein n=1 Tax=Ochrobactrum quorumnocens TaxID=271865 RepID=A0A248UIB5_9HYPH|nr:hypothetical protein CES85_0671 [[Ochrobactrum] quorumnocens]
MPHRLFEIYDYASHDLYLHQMQKRLTCIHLKDKIAAFVKICGGS